ncbi:MAG: hypothetical protein HY652_06115 [Acidobacteria bacterium]|nr:hypothetical protein [Acidobacteriota bacterium]
MIGWILLGLLAFAWLFLILLARRNEARVAREWQALLSPEIRTFAEQVGGTVRARNAMLELAMGRAVQVQRLRNVEEAIQLLDAGCQILRQFTPSLLALLGVLGRFSRMVVALTPVEPLWPGDFNLAHMVTLSYLHQMMHRMLVSARQRLRLKIYILGKGIQLTTDFLLAGARAIFQEKSEKDEDWELIAAGFSDYRTLSEESLRTFDLLLRSLPPQAAQQLKNRLLQG